MSNERLTQHYEWRYRGESSMSAVETIRRTERPGDRFEAAALHLPELLPEGAEVLEIGAGTGHVAKTVLERRPDVAGYTLSDISRPRLEGIRNTLDDDRVAIREMDADDPPAELVGRYDAVILIALIEHLIDPIGSMRSVRTLLKPGGFVYVDTPNIARYAKRLQLLRGRFPSTGSRNEGLTTFGGEPADLYDEGHFHYFTFRSLGLMLTDFCGYERVRKLPYAGGVKPLGVGVHDVLAKAWPGMFSELLLVAHAPR